MFQPSYQISPQLLATIKRITILVHEFNKRSIPGLALAQLLHEARVTSTYASTSIEGNPLPLTEVRRILKNRPAQVRQSENVTRYFQKVGVFGNYYDLVDGLDFTAWLEYFAEGIWDELLRLEKSLEQSASSPSSRLQTYHQQILDYIEQHGFITDSDYAKLTARAKATRSLDFNKLIELGLIERQGRGRSVYYVLKK